MELVIAIPTSARGRWSLGVRHPEQVAPETDAPCEDGIDDHPLHPTVPKTEEVIRNEQAEGSERTGPEQDRHIGERMIVYPVLTWGIGFGGYLLGMSHSQ